MTTYTKQSLRERRHARVRAKIEGTAEKPRLSLFKSHKHLYAQLIDDESGVTLAAASDRELSGTKLTPREKAVQIGELIAKKGLAKKIATVVFDRSGYQYSGKIRELAEGARKGGLKF